MRRTDTTDGGLGRSRLGTLLLIVRLGRPHFVLAGVALYLFGALAAVVSGPAVAPSALRLIAGCVPFLLAINSVSYSNDYFDRHGDRLDGSWRFSGGSGVLLEHPELANFARGFAMANIVLSLVSGAVATMVLRLTPWYSGLLVISNLLGWFYSAPPLRFSAKGLGELDTAFCIGVLIPGMGYLVTARRLDGPFWQLLPAIAAYGLAFILTVEIPDMEADRLSGKRNWVSRGGRAFAFSLVGGLLSAASVYFLTLSRSSLLLSGLRASGRAPARHSLGQIADLLSSRAPGQIVGLLSLMPAVAGLQAMLERPLLRTAAARAVNRIILSTTAFVILVDLYLAFLIWI